MSETASTPQLQWKLKEVIFVSLMYLGFLIWMLFLNWKSDSPIKVTDQAPSVSGMLALTLTTLGTAVVGISTLRSWIRSHIQSNAGKAGLVAGYLLIPWAIQFMGDEFKLETLLYFGFVVLPSILLVVEWKEDETIGWIGRVILLLLIWVSHDSHWDQAAWPNDGLNVANTALQAVTVFILAFIVFRELPGYTYDLDILPSDLLYGLRSVAILFGILVPLGLWLHFLSFNPNPDPVLWFGILVEIFIRVAILEEFIFRALLQKWMDDQLHVDLSRTRSILSLFLVSIIFGLFHANNLSDLVNTIIYVVFATIAGIFYALAWRAEKRVLAAIITHTFVDLLWFVVFYGGTGA